MSVAKSGIILADVLVAWMGESDIRASSNIIAARLGFRIKIRDIS